MMKTIITIICLFCLAFLAMPLTAQVKSGSLNNDQKMLKRVKDYFTAYNTGDPDKMKEYFLANMSKEEMERFPLDARIDRYKQLYNTRGELKRTSEGKVEGNEVIITAEDKNGSSLEFGFMFEPNEFHGFMAFKVTDSGNRTKKKIGSTDKKNENELVSSVKEYVKQLASKDEFSGTLLIAKNGKIILEDKYGFQNREKKILNNIGTAFNLGSIIKNFTRRAIMQLAAENKLSLKDNIKKYLPDYPNKVAAEKVTIEQLLEMKSGIGDIFGPKYESADKEKIKTISDYLPLFADLPLEFEPGTKERYSNGGYIVLGAIIEKISGKDYYTFIEENIFKPAGMTRSGFFEKDKLPENCAIGYSMNGGKMQSNYQTLPGKGSSAGGGYSTLHDLLAYINYFMAGKEQQGLGIGGGAPGLNAALEYNPESGYVVIVLANLDPPAAEGLAEQIMLWLPK